LCEEKAPAIADVRVVVAKLMTVVTKGQRPFQVVGQGSEASEVTPPSLVIEMIESDTSGPAIVPVAQPTLGKIGRRYGVKEIVPEISVERIRFVLS
jgi:hypothetical protein